MRLLFRWIATFPLWGAISASPVGNPAFPKIIEQGFFIPKDSPISIRVGYEGDFVSDARLQQENGGTGRVDCFKQNTNSGVFTATWSERADFYGVMGASQFTTDWRFEEFQNNTWNVHRVQTETNTHFLWAVGSRIILFKTTDMCVGAGGRYSFCEANPLWLTIDAINQKVSGSRIRWKEWQVDLDFSYQIDIFVPYIGIKYSFVTASIGSFLYSISSGSSGTNHFETRQPVGATIGCTISNGKYFMLNVEGRLIDEEALTISGDLKF